jgi:ABC-type multidrug transport system fused ATPase/permease subunit
MLESESVNINRQKNMLPFSEEKDGRRTPSLHMEASNHGTTHKTGDHQDHVSKADVQSSLEDILNISDTANRLRAWTYNSCDGAPKVLGVSFKNLRVHGSSTKSDYHHTVLDYPLKLTKFIPFSAKTQRSKVNILYGIDGLIQPGELLLVLGRPGSGCSTFLKTLAGEMHGIHLSAQSQLNYQCLSSPIIILEQTPCIYIYSDHVKISPTTRCASCFVANISILPSTIAISLS